MKHELNDFPLLKSLQNTPLPEVPEGYFDSFGDNLLSALKLEDYKLLFFEEMPPSGYFDTLTEKVLFQVDSTDLKAQAYKDIPEGYFESFTKKILEKVGEKENLPQIFTKIPPQTETDEEKAYFENFERRLMDKIQSTEKPKVGIIPVISLWSGSSRKLAIGIAATVLLGFGINFLYLNTIKTENDSISFKNISDQGLMEYLSEDESLDIEILKETLPLSEIQSKPSSDSKFKGISDDELLEYLDADDFGEI